MSAAEGAIVQAAQKRPLDRRGDLQAPDEDRRNGLLNSISLEISPG